MTDGFLGELRIFCGDFAPVGWRLCDGSRLELADHVLLANVIGITYGGDGRQVVVLPDLRGRIAIGASSSEAGSTSPAYPIGSVGGSDGVTLIGETLPAHRHGLNVSTTMAASAVPSPSLTFGSMEGGGLFYVDPTKGTPSGSSTLGHQSVSTAGSSEPHENVMPSLAINYIICIDGDYPAA